MTPAPRITDEIREAKQALLSAGIQDHRYLEHTLRARIRNKRQLTATLSTCFDYLQGNPKSPWLRTEAKAIRAWYRALQKTAITLKKDDAFYKRLHHEKRERLDRIASSPDISLIFSYDKKEACVSRDLQVLHQHVTTLFATPPPPLLAELMEASHLNDKRALETLSADRYPHLFRLAAIESHHYVSPSLAAFCEKQSQEAWQDFVTRDLQQDFCSSHSPRPPIADKKESPMPSPIPELPAIKKKREAIEHALDTLLIGTNDVLLLHEEDIHRFPCINDAISHYQKGTETRLMLVFTEFDQAHHWQATSFHLYEGRAHFTDFQLRAEHLFYRETCPLSACQSKHLAILNNKPDHAKNKTEKKLHQSLPVRREQVLQQREEALRLAEQQKQQDQENAKRQYAEEQKKVEAFKKAYRRHCRAPWTPWFFTSSLPLGLGRSDMGVKILTDQPLSWAEISAYTAGQKAKGLTTASVLAMADLEKDSPRPIARPSCSIL